MKKVKLFVFLVILVLIALIGYLNKDYLLSKQIFNLWFDSSHQTPAISNLVLLLGFFLAGLLLALLLSLRGRWRSRRAIKELTGKVTSSREKITAMENELASLKPAGPKSVEAVEGSVNVSS